MSSLVCLRVRGKLDVVPTSGRLPFESVYSLKSLPGTVFEMAGCTDTCVSFGLPPEEGADSSKWGCPAGQKLIAMPRLTASVKTFRVLLWFQQQSE